MIFTILLTFFIVFLVTCDTHVARRTGTINIIVEIEKEKQINKNNQAPNLQVRRYENSSYNF